MTWLRKIIGIFLEKCLMSQRLLKVVKIVFFLQCLGLAGLAWLDGSKLSVFLFLETSLAEIVSLQVNWALMVCLLVLGTTGFFRMRAGYFYVAGLIFFVEALLAAYLGGDYAAKYTPFAQFARFGWLFVIGAGWYFAASQPLSLGLRRRLRQGLTLLLAVTFFVHGLEALSHHPKFIDLLLVASRKILFFSASEAMARWLLILIGIVDIICGVLIIFRYHPIILYYMAAWGAITAFARVIDGGLLHVPDALVRSAHWGIPIMIYFLKNDEKNLIDIEEMTEQD